MAEIRRQLARTGSFLLACEWDWTWDVRPRGKWPYSLSHFSNTIYFHLIAFWERISLYSHGCPGTNCVDQVGLNSKGLPTPLPSKWWGWKCVRLCPSSEFLRLYILRFLFCGMQKWTHSLVNIRQYSPSHWATRKPRIIYLYKSIGERWSGESTDNVH